MRRLIQLQEQLTSQGVFDADELSRILFGEHYKKRTEAWKVVRQNQMLQDHFHLNDYNLGQLRSKTFNKLQATYGKVTEMDEVRNFDFSVANKLTLFSNGFTSNDMNFCILGGVHSYLYNRALYQLGTEKHKDIYLRAVNMQDVGCFGLTELYHGSNVKGILTEAHYDHNTKTFVIHTPKQEAMKFWIGAAAKTATSSVIWAQLYIENKCHGVHAFVVPLRDRKTLKTLPGVLIGDCGHKSGLNGVDNGFLLFEHVRIPKDNLLDRISGVDDSGKFRSIIENEDKRFGLHLGALSGGRFFIGTNCSSLSLQALTIAIRYANVRRQFKGSKDQEQKKLIEYPMMKRRLMPLLATNLVYYRTSMHYIALSDNNFEKFMDEKNPLIEQLHAISSIIKAKTSWFASECIQECRQAMGGHGYSSYSKIGTIYNDNDINLTWQGDNHVLIQQTSKYVLEQAQRVLQKGKTSNNPLLHFLNNAPSEMIEFSRSSLTSIDKGMQFLQYKLMRKIQQTGMRMLELKTKNLPIMDIWNNSQVFLGREVAMIYGDIAMLDVMKEGIAMAKNPLNRDVLETATRLWLLRSYRDDEFVDMTHHSLLETLIQEDCKKIEAMSLDLLRAIAPDDMITGSPFADPNGQGMEKYLQIILSKPANQRVDWWEMLIQK